MGFRINQNVGAMIALYNLQQNDTAMNSSIEKLSTGLRIVRGADDPSGLVLSQRFQAQVAGVGQAISNAKDGINMVQTAEGSLNEVSNILRNMRDLAVHAANTGPNDTPTLQADQNQIAEQLKTLDRIASTTQFGSKRVLDGSAGVIGTVTNPDVSFVGGTTDTATGTYAVNVTTAATKGLVTSNAGAGAGVARGTMDFTGAALATGGTTPAPTSLTAAGSITVSGALVGGSGITVNLANGDTLSNIVDKLNQNADFQAAGLTASIATNATAGTKTLTVTSDRLSNGTSADLDLVASSSDVAGVTGLSASANGGNYTTDNATAASKLRENELLTFSNGTNNVNVALTSGMTMAAAVSAVNTALSNAGIGVTAAFDSSNAWFTLQNNDYGSASTVKNTFSSNETGALSTGLAGTADQTYNLAGSGVTLSGNDGANGEDVAGTIGGYAATGSGQVLTGGTGTDVQGLQLKIAGSTTGSDGDVNVINNSLNFQIGAFANQTASLAIDSVAANQLGTDASGTTSMSNVSLANIDVTTSAGAQDAIKVVDAAIAKVSALRARMGAFQSDILQNTVSSLGVAQQNLTSTESNITDADFATQMMNYSREQILSQTGMSMLAQANKSGQLVLKLFQ